VKIQKEDITLEDFVIDGRWQDWSKRKGVEGFEIKQSGLK
jgi:hypothetical protein